MTPLKMLLSVAFATTALSGFAQSKAPVFTTIKANAITSVKDQNRSGTCWDYATCGFLESEILRKTVRIISTVPTTISACMATAVSRKAAPATTW